MSTRTEVRCCCEPTRLRGWIETADLTNGQILKFPIYGHNKRKRVATVRLEAAEYWDGVHHYVCLKAKDIQMRLLRRIDRFKENA